MFLIDDILLAPIKGIQWIAKEIDKAAQSELEQQGEDLTRELTRLYMLLETGRIEEAEFEEREAELLERMEQLSSGGASEATDEVPSDDEADDDDDDQDDEDEDESGDTSGDETDDG